MYIGWNLNERMLIAMNSEEFENRYPIVQAHLRLGYFQGKSFPSVYIEFIGLCPCEHHSLKISKENSELIEKMKSELLRTLVETMGTSFYFVDTYEPSVIKRFIDFGECEFSTSGNRYMAIPTTEQLDLDRK
jgi:hypothetical protein